jgi:hypothetical protein
MMRYLLGFSLFILLGCSTKPTTTEFTILDFENALAASYNYLEVFGDHYLPINDLASDQLGVPGFGSHLSTGSQIEELVRNQWTPNNNMLTNMWNDLYNGVNAANNALAIATEVKEDIDEDLLAEARALRAFNFFLLMDVFGNIQAFKEEVLLGTVVVPQSTRAEVFSFIEAELIAMIPLLKADASYGKMTRTVAQMILAKLYLNAEVYTGTPQWAACRDACAAIIASGNYQLVGDYFDLFATDNHILSADEIILASPDAPNTHPSLLSVHPAQIDTKSPSTSGFANWAATPELFIQFDSINDLRAGSFLRGTQLTSAGNAILDVAGDSVQYSFNFSRSNQFINGYRVLKYAVDNTKTNYGDNDFVIFRYADVLLMQAEALNELGESASAIQLINELRERAYSVASPLSAGDFTQETLRTQILTERSNELFWEGWRRQDLIRQSLFCTATWTQRLRVPDGCENLRLFPIPASILAVNTNLVQNPGY